MPELRRPACACLLAALCWASPRTARAQAKGAYERAIAAYYDGRLTEAAKALEEAAAADPRDAKPLLDAAVVYRELEKHDLEREALAKAARLQPDDPDVQSALGWADLVCGDRLAAASAFGAARVMAPANEQALLGMARVELQQDNPKGALETLDTLLQAHPEFTLGHVYAARADAALGQPQAAVEAYKRAISSDPLYSEARLWLGPLYAKADLFADAFQQYAKVLNVAPRNATARREYGRLAKLAAGAARQALPERKAKEFEPVVGTEPAKGEPYIRVAVGTTVRGTPAAKKEVAFMCSGRFELFDPDSGKRAALGSGGKTWVARRAAKGSRYEVVDEQGRRQARFGRVLAVRPLDAGKDSFIFQRLNIADGTVWAEQGDRQLKHTVELRALGSRGLYLVNKLPLEDYVYGVVNGEMPSHFPLEAQKAQAIIARTEALYAKEILHRHRKHGYDVCDGQHCQVYGGVEEETPVGRSAVDATRGITIRSADGRLARTPYSSNCGGHTQDSAEVQGWGKVAHLRGRKDVDGEVVERKSPWDLDLWVKGRPQVYCNVPKYMHPAQFRWSRIIEAADLGERIRSRSKKFGLLRSVRVLRRSASGNVNKIEFRGSKGRFVVDKEHVIRAILGLSSARSTMFVVETERDAKGAPVELVLYGGGWGHGIGLCQLGAAGRAEAGQTVRQILGHYYAGAVFNRLPYAPAAALSAAVATSSAAATPSATAAALPQEPAQASEESPEAPPKKAKAEPKKPAKPKAAKAGPPVPAAAATAPKKPAKPAAPAKTSGKTKAAKAPTAPAPKDEARWTRASAVNKAPKTPANAAQAATGSEF